MGDSRRIRAATFDCYGTLVDWEGGAAAFLYGLWRRLGVAEPPPGRLLRERWERIQFEVIAGPYRRYGEVLRESLQRLFEEHRLPWDQAHGDAFADAMRAWQPFPDTLPALRRARAAGLRLMIVSNTDRDIMAHTQRQLEVPFDLVQVAEDVQAYKPSPVPFSAALERLGLPPDEVLHVAFGFEYDMGPAAAHGMRTAWVNRHGAGAPVIGVRADHEWRDLWGLAELAEAQTAAG